jgi:hypothetical protein
MSRWVYVALLATVLGGTPPQLLGQRMGFSVGHAPAFPAATRNSSLTISFHARPFRTFQHPVLFPGFFSSPFLFSDYPDQPALIETAPAAPPVVIVERPSVTSEEKPAQLLLLERRGDVFVRVHSPEQEGDAAAGGEPEKQIPRERKPARKESSEVPGGVLASALPTVLVFRDGRREETSSYAIVKGVLYEASDYWSTGAWTKSVNLATLDLPATVRENELRGTRFLLPSGPNEVVIRP